MRTEATVRIFCYNPHGYCAGLVQIEVDLRRGLPAIELVGLAGGAVREARERVRAAIGNSGFEFPLGHIIISLAPSNVPKAGAGFDLAIALALLDANTNSDRADSSSLLVMGELSLAGKVRRVDAIIPALLEARQAGIKRCLIPSGNAAEARLVLPNGGLYAEDLRQAFDQFQGQRDTPSNQAIDITLCTGWSKGQDKAQLSDGEFDQAIFRREPLLFLGLMAAAAGRHHLLVYGPPGVGKTMALRFLGKLLPALRPADLLEVNRLHSLAGRLDGESGLLQSAPIRMPHHGSSAEALLGGGKFGKPGELSLAHHGLLILDEAAEFRKNVLQALREPMEDGMVRLGRVEGMVRYPASFLLGMSLNPCPCGKYGSQSGSCACSALEVQHYWARLGAPVIDRVDIRVRLGKAAPGLEQPDQGPAWSDLPLFGLIGDLDKLRECIRQAADRQPPANGVLRGLQVEERCQLSAAASRHLADWVAVHGLLSRSRHGILRLARTIADLTGQASIGIPELDAALHLRSPITPVDGISLFQ